MGPPMPSLLSLRQPSSTLSHPILIPTMTDHAKAEEEVAADQVAADHEEEGMADQVVADHEEEVAADHGGESTMAACPPVPAVVVADLWVETPQPCSMHAQVASELSSTQL